MPSTALWAVTDAAHAYALPAHDGDAQKVTQKKQRKEKQSKNKGKPSKKAAGAQQPLADADVAADATASISKRKKGRKSTS